MSAAGQIVAVVERAEVLEWLDERRVNCLRIAATKPGEDRDGWLEDAAYFTAAIAFIRAGAPSEKAH